MPAAFASRYVIFNLPFPLLLPDSVSLEDTNAGELAPEIYIAGDPPAGVKTVLLRREGGTFEATGELEGGDPYGRVSFTRVQVRFHSDTSPEISLWTDDDLIAHAVRATGVLITHYRDIARQPLLRRPSVPDLVHFWIVDEAADGSSTKRTVARGRGPLRLGIGEEQGRVDAELRARLQRAEEVPFLRALSLDVDAHIGAGDYRLAVIESATFFEAWLRRQLQDRFAAQGLHPVAIREKFAPVRRGRERFLFITEIARVLIPEAFGQDFMSSDAGRRWQAAITIRNALVHGDRDRVSEIEAREVLDAITAACRAISSMASSNG